MKYADVGESEGKGQRQKVKTNMLCHLKQYFCVIAAHKASPGDLLTICTHAELERAETARWQPKLVDLNADNCITRSSYGEFAAV